jgi:glycosyltransferase involved in cell wall biosynthesis
VPQTDPTARPESATLVIVSYNHARYVEQCLDSAFAQTYDDLRVIIFDDCSTDNSVEVIESYLDRTGAEATFIAHQVNRGLCATLNEALQLIDTEFVAFISADDWNDVSRLQRQVEELTSRGTDYCLVYSDARIATEDGEDTGATYYGELGEQRGSKFVPPRGSVYTTELLDEQVCTPTALCRVSALRAVDGYDESLAWEDTDMWLRLAQRWKFTYIDDSLVTKRTTPGSLRESRFHDPTGYFLTSCRIYQKHLGHSHETDRSIAIRLGGIAKDAYLAGDSSDSILEALRLAWRYQRSLTTLVYLVAHRLRVPNEWVRRVVVLCRSIRARWSE